MDCFLCLNIRKVGFELSSILVIALLMGQGVHFGHLEAHRRVFTHMVEGCMVGPVSLIGSQTTTQPDEVMSSKGTQRLKQMQ